MNQQYGMMNSFGGQQPSNFQVQRIQQATINGNESNPLHSSGMGMSMGGYGGQQSFNQAYQNQGYQNQGFGGQSQMSSAYPQEVQRIHQNSILNGGSQGEQGYGAQQSFNQGYQNQAYQNQYQNQAYQNQYGGGMQGVNQAQIERIHQNSMFGGQSQMSNAYPQEMQRIHQNSIFNGGSQGEQSYGFGAQQSMNQGYQNQNQAYQNQAYQNQAYQNQYGGGMQGVNQAQVERIHQNSLFNGRSQGSQASQGYGASMNMMGGQNQGYSNPNAFRQVMNADAGITDQEGPNSYPASMYRGNQYDTVNQSVMNQMHSMAGMGGQYGRQF